MMQAENTTPNGIHFDGEINVATGASRKETRWKNRSTKWSVLLERMAAVQRTQESFAEFMAMPKGAQDDLKDVGGFVGGVLKDGRRRAGFVANRQIIALDADFAPVDFQAKLDALPFAWAMYTTRKHSPDKPRLRIVIPTDTPMIPDEYAAVSRRIAGDLGIDIFDDTTFEVERLMYWPSCSRDSEFLFRYNDADWLKVADVKARYADWRDVSQWPVADRFKGEIEKRTKKAGNPRDKRGVVGAFCRAYDIADAIENFLSDVYEATTDPRRYSYAQGSTTLGLVVYDGLFAYSHHGTDPAGSQLCNAFDLVRIHRYGTLDVAASTETPINRLPSYAAMTEWAVGLAGVKAELASGDSPFDAIDDATADAGRADWRADLTFNPNTGALNPTRNNYRLILANHPDVAGKLRYNEFLQMPVLYRDAPWRRVTDTSNGDIWSDADMAYLATWFEGVMSTVPAPAILRDAMVTVMRDAPLHPVRDYLEALEWDGTQRGETVFSRYLGVIDDDYGRAVARLFLTSAVARIFEPGCKVDTMPILVGDQGYGKSSVIRILGKGWTSDSMTSMEGKEAVEQLQGSWIIEVAELTATRRSDVEKTKHFISKQIDKARLAYQAFSSWFPRQCVFIGTTNDQSPLVDMTGNRRFLMLKAGADMALYDWKTELEEEVDQIWAEAVLWYRQGGRLYLEGEMARQAAKIAEDHRHDSGMQGQIEDWLNEDVPVEWNTWNAEDRRLYRQGVAVQKDGTTKRDRACAREVWVECLGGDLHNLTTQKAKEINDTLAMLKGWRRATTVRVGGGYGHQKGFVRVNQSEA